MTNDERRSMNRIAPPLTTPFADVLGVPGERTDLLPFTIPLPFATLTFRLTPNSFFASPVAGPSDSGDCSCSGVCSWDC